MAKNSFISNFKWRPFVLAFVFFVMGQWLCLIVSDVTQEGSKQAVKQKRIWARTPGFFKSDDKEIIVAFGNSKIGAGFLPDEFDRIHPQARSYNMALIGLQTPPHYFMLKDMIEHGNTPDWILLQYSPGGFNIESFPSYAIQGAGFWEALHYARYRKDWDVFLNYIFPSRLHWPEVSRYVVSKVLRWMPQSIQNKYRTTYLGRSDGNSLYGHNRKHFYESQYVHPEENRKKLLENLHKDRGYYYIVEQAADGGVISEDYLVKVGAWRSGQTKDTDVLLRMNKVLGIDQEGYNEDTETTGDLPPFMKEFFDLAQKHHIKIVIIDSYALSPNGKDPENFDKRFRLSGELKQIMRMYPNVFAPKEAKGPMLFGLENFSDPGHVNRQGAAKFTAILALEFSDVLNQIRP